MWVLRRSIFENERMRPTNDGMPLSEEIKILARRHLGKTKAIEIAVPYRARVGEAEIHTWGDGWKNLRFPCSTIQPPSNPNSVGTRHWEP